MSLSLARKYLDLPQELVCDFNLTTIFAPPPSVSRIPLIAIPSLRLCITFCRRLDRYGDLTWLQGPV
jgi:hypothetical protein